MFARIFAVVWGCCLSCSCLWAAGLELGDGHSLSEENDFPFRAAVSGGNLHVASGSPSMKGDVYVFVTDRLDAPRPAPWSRDAIVYFDTQKSPWWVVRYPERALEVKNIKDGDWTKIDGRTGVSLSFDIARVFGRIPAYLYIFSTRVVPRLADHSFQVADQFPGRWDGDSSVQPYEFQKIPVSSIADENRDGVFDVGSPELLFRGEDGEYRDANYGLARYYIDEAGREEGVLSVKFRPNAAGGVKMVEIFTNLNRRDQAVLDPSGQKVKPDSDGSSYYMAKTMKGPDADGWFTADLPVKKCGAYRLQARYKVEGSPDYVYYTDKGLRRDLAVVVSPSKAKSLIIYEVNPLVAGATGPSFDERGLMLNLIGEPSPGFLDKLPKLGGSEKQGAVGDREIYNEEFYRNLGVNMLWLQPIHPTGREFEEIDKLTGEPHQVGSPYSVADFWSVTPLLGTDNTSSQAMKEFSRTVEVLDKWGVGVMVDGTFNHCARDAILGEGAGFVGLSRFKKYKIRDIRPMWFSKKGRPSLPASKADEIAVAPDRPDLRPWDDVVDFYYGDYDELAFENPPKNPTTGYRTPTGALWSHRLTGDSVGPLSPETKELWEYMSNYPVYWLSKTGHPKGTPAKESYKGIDGLRCDFAQGLPSQFWEYCINKTRRVKWDFVFMAESLDGVLYNSEGDPRGVGYRSARHFDVLNESMTFYWRDRFFGYPVSPDLDGGGKYSTWDTRDAFESRWKSYEGCLILNNLTSHDEIFPHNDPYSLLAAYFQTASMPGLPMVFYGQEAGAQNWKDKYAYTEKLYGPISADRNFAKYELNLEKYIPNFKSFNDMRSVWRGRDRDLGIEDLYGRINRFRLSTPAMTSPNFRFLTKWGEPSNVVNEVFSVLRKKEPYTDAGGDPPVIAVANNNYRRNPKAAGMFSLNLPWKDGAHYAGIDAGKFYMLKNALSDTPGKPHWNAPKSGAEILSKPLEIGFPIDGRQMASFILEEVSPPGSAAAVGGQRAAP